MIHPTFMSLFDVFRGQSGDFKMTPRYQKVIYGQYFQNFVRPDSTRRLPYQGYLGHMFYASVGETLQIGKTFHYE